MIETDDCHRARADDRKVRKRDQCVQQRPLLMQAAQLLDRQRGREILLQLLRVIGVVGRHPYSVINTSSAPG